MTDTLGRGTASKILDKCFGRSKHGWTTPYQIKGLIERGIDAEQAVKTRSDEAKKFIAENPLGPTDKQIFKLRQLGFHGDATSMTRKEASQKIDFLMGNMKDRQ